MLSGQLQIWFVLFSENLENIVFNHKAQCSIFTSSKRRKQRDKQCSAYRRNAEQHRGNGHLLLMHLITIARVSNFAFLLFPNFVKPKKSEKKAKMDTLIFATNLTPYPSTDGLTSITRPKKSSIRTSLSMSSRWPVSSLITIRWTRLAM